MSTLFEPGSYHYLPGGQFCSGVKAAAGFALRRVRFLKPLPIAQGMADHVGSVEVGKLADLVIWERDWFGTKPTVVVKGGIIAWAMMGDANGSSVASLNPLHAMHP